MNMPKIKTLLRWAALITTAASIPIYAVYRTWPVKEAELDYPTGKLYRYSKLLNIIAGKPALIQYCKGNWGDTNAIYAIKELGKEVTYGLSNQGTNQTN